MVMALGACRHPDSRRPLGPPAGRCSVSPQDDACDVCEANQCCPEETACRGDRACRAADDELDACEARVADAGHPALSACYARFAATGAKAAQRADCLRSRCPNVCL
jgi:hypothetical protein